MALNPNSNPGQPDGPADPDNWKRAVYRAPPSRFTVEMLPPVKIGGTHNFQIRVCPIARGDRSSVSSKGSNTEYEILRRWEDCLLFQDTLEREYSRLAVSKRRRLLAGKGVRKNGIYLHSDKASSWESLPPGPEPDSVAQSIHDFVPRLTKKGTMFRASQATIDQRQAELTAFITALFVDNVPTLLEDFRRDRIVTDFFGFWRRDQDIQKKANAATPSNRRSSTSSSFVSSSVFASYFSAASDSGEDSTAWARVRAHSSASSDSSSALSSAGSARSSLNVQITLDDKPVPFGHNPNLGADNLDSVQEVSDLARKGSRSGRGGLLSAVARRVRKTPAGESTGRRERQSLDEQPARPDSRASTVNQAHRDSWQSTASGMTFMNDLNLTLPNETNEDRPSRMSMASIATFRTEVSSDGVIPRYYVPEPNPSRLSTASFMTDVSADAIIPRPDSRATLTRGTRAPHMTSSIASDGDSVLDEYFYDAFPRPCSFIPEAPEQSRPQTPKSQESHSHPSSSSSPTTVEATKIPLPTSPPLDALPSPPISPTASEFKPPRSPSFNAPDSPRTPSANFFPRKEFLRAHSPNGSVASASMSIMSDSTTNSSFSDSTNSTITPSIYSWYSAKSTLSATTTTSYATTTSSSTSSPLTIKAAHNDSIILLRVDEDLSLSEVRRRLRDKFLGQEGIALAETFSLAYMIPASPNKASVQTQTRKRANSTGTLLDTALMEMISTEEEWARLRASLDGAKLALRVIDSTSRPA
ncbi:hypothetical protein DFH06DRAFT_502445 [Mycena polygramma]|nr:hypothetical protein DFH06DRAFT_502445 [Mycena polygramma]